MSDNLQRLAVHIGGRAKLRDGRECTIIDVNVEHHAIFVLADGADSDERMSPDDVVSSPNHTLAPYLREFPDYKPADMPALPDGFEDASWHNDACPSFVSDPIGLLIWIDFANPAEREFPEVQRFNVVQQRAGIEVSGPFLQTDDWSEVLAFIELQRQRVTYNGGVYYVAN